MAIFPFFALLTEVIALNSTGTLQYQVAVNEEFTVSEIRQGSTGTFRITAIRDSRGNQYANFDSSDYAIGTLFSDVDDANNGIQKLPVPLVIPGGTTLYFDVRDGSGAENTIRIYLVGQRKTG